MLPFITITLPSYAIFATFGLIIAVLFAYFRTDSVELSFGKFVLYLIVCGILAVIMAKLLFVITKIPEIIQDINLLTYYLRSGGIVFYGGLFGVFLGIYITSKWIGRIPKGIYEVCAPAIPLFHAFARIGCLLAGCCYGVKWKWGVVLQGENFARFPVQFFEAVCNLVIFAVILSYEHIKGRNNNIYIYLGLYAGCRFVLEFFRGDSVRGIWLFGLSTAQIISIIIICVVFRHLFLVHMENMNNNSEM